MINRLNNCSWVLVPPKLTKIPDRSYTIYEGATAELSCEAFGFPPPTIAWTRPLFALPKERSSVSHGTLRIEDFRPGDTGTYMCTATNKLGSVKTLTALGIHELETGKNSLRMPYNYYYYYTFLNKVYTT